MQHVAPGEQNRAFYDVFQFAHVTRPFHAAQRTQGFGGNAVDIAPHPAGNFEGEGFHQQRNIFRALAQRRQMDREDVQSIVEIVTKLAIGDHLFQIAVSGSDQANVGLDQFIAAQTFKLLLLQNAQQLGLKLQRHVANFIEK